MKLHLASRLQELFSHWRVSQFWRRVSVKGTRTLSLTFKLALSVKVYQCFLRYSRQTVCSAPVPAGRPEKEKANSCQSILLRWRCVAASETCVWLAIFAIFASSSSPSLPSAEPRRGRHLWPDVCRLRLSHQVDQSVAGSSARRDSLGRHAVSGCIQRRHRVELDKRPSGRRQPRSGAGRLHPTPGLAEFHSSLHVRHRYTTEHFSATVPYSIDGSFVVGVRGCQWRFRGKKLLRRTVRCPGLISSDIGIDSPSSRAPTRHRARIAPHVIRRPRDRHQVASRGTPSVARNLMAVGGVIRRVYQPQAQLWLSGVCSGYNYLKCKLRSAFIAGENFCIHSELLTTLSYDARNFEADVLLIQKWCEQ